MMLGDLVEELSLLISLARMVKSAIRYKGHSGAAFTGVIKNLLIIVGGVEVITYVFMAKVMDP